MRVVFLKKIAICLLWSVIAIHANAQIITSKTPFLANNLTQKQLIVDGKPFIMLAGELHNSSASSPEYMRDVWNRLKRFNLNTVLASVTWEMVEPQEGKFDFSSVDSLILSARKHNLKLVLLWFGTWKNACSSYVPEWVKKDTRRFFRSENINGEKLNHISPLCTEANVADAKAFAALMKHLKESDLIDNTVITIQVENESGIRGDSRDRSKAADIAFKEHVPSVLIKYLVKNKDKLNPALLKIWAFSDFKTEGSWRELFGSDAELMFMSYYTASYIDKVAAAGKQEYTLPMYANAWIEWDGNKPGDYPSGGPVARMIPVWQAAAPNIDILAPDIYQPDFTNRCEMHQQMGNPLFIPEVMPDLLTASNVFYAIGLGAICYSPFAIDNLKFFTEEHPMVKSYELLTHLMPYLVKYQGTGKMTGILGNKGDKKIITLGKYMLQYDFTGSEKPDLPGYGIVIALNDDEFLVVGSGFNVTFLSKPSMPKRTEILWAYQLIYKNGEWIRERRLNGDETGVGSDHNIQLRFDDGDLAVKTAKVFSYE